MDNQSSNEQEDRRKISLSRRGFLKSAGLVTTGVVAAPILRNLVPSWQGLPSLGLPGTERRTFKVGALIPGSSVYPQLGQDQIDGLELGFRKFSGLNPNLTVDLVREDIGTARRSSYAKTIKLVVEDKVDIVVGTVGTHALYELHDLFVGSKTPFIVNSVGEHVVTQAEHSPFIFHNSLNLWQSNFATGVWAADKLGQRAYIAMSFYDSGYDSAAAFIRGFESRGGRRIGLRSTHLTDDDDGMETLIEAIEEANPDFVYGAYSGQEAVEFVRAYGRSGLSAQAPLVGSAFMVDDNILPSHGPDADGITSALTWSLALETPGNREFVSAYMAWTGRAPSVFSVLGYDAARLIAEALRQVEGDSTRSIQFLGALARAEFDSPRGHISVNPQTQTTTSSIYLRKVIGSRNEVVGKLDPISETEDLGFTASTLRSGWKNSYLAI